MAAAAISLCGSRCVGPSRKPEPRLASQAGAAPCATRPSSSRRRLVVAAAKSSGKKADEKVPSWARPGSDEPPPWARDEGGASGQDGEAAQVPFYAYLLASAVTAIAAIGSIFEYTNGRAVFGVVGTDSPLYAPILGFFAVTGIPTSGYLWYKAVQTANKDAEEQDRRDGFL
ncbi:uncharacterized protein LOC125527121 [Triticum urartu]|uniref:uncharacterized protein LOC119284675 n=1 Tax=Triticum dicoccoides TaxID=85692 RepID=UPI00188EBE4B|nr:uncharacterized protein LOC119284675 [Triticum dicoccoides]XP_048543294.1 uncharacterized protein LOC125522257 [Triticum urartu]XP_048543354.1 uncharacterized protein LOC125522336 [Triticum urartu]XP_048547645.1 uncharacterized protein LOC125527121 [Triticum urartu]